MVVHSGLSTLTLRTVRFGPERTLPRVFPKAGLVAMNGVTGEPDATLSLGLLYWPFGCRRHAFGRMQRKHNFSIPRHKQRQSGPDNDGRSVLGGYRADCLG